MSLDVRLDIARISHGYCDTRPSTSSDTAYVILVGPGWTLGNDSGCFKTCDVGVYPGRNGYTCLNPLAAVSMAVERAPPGTRVATMPRCWCAGVGFGAGAMSHRSLSLTARSSQQYARMHNSHQLSVSFQ